MKEFNPPKINTESACIMADQNPVVGALVSSYFNDPGTYFSTFVFPEVHHPFSPKNEFHHDGFVARMIGTEATTLINNAMAKLGPDKVFLAGLNEAQKTYIRHYLPDRIIVEIDSVADIEKALNYLNKLFDGEVSCRSSEIMQGLLFSKFTNHKLKIDESAPSLDTKFVNNQKGAVIIENGNEADDVVAINYGFSVGADVFLVPSIDRQEIHGLQKHIYQWKKQDSQKSYQKIKKKVNQRVSGVKFKDYTYSTFFTQGLPYGLILRNIIPFTHVMRHLRSDFLIFNNIAYEDLDIGNNSAIVFSPKEFKYEETEDVIKILEQNNYFIKKLLEEDATVNNFSNYVGHYPYDLLHICSHGGETDGYYIIEDFEDRNGQTHTVEYEEVVGFSPHDNDRVNVFTKAIFRRFDGFPWMSNELRAQNTPNYVFEDMRKALFQNNSFKNRKTRVPANYPIYTSCHIKCYDSIHQGQFRMLASHGSPVIFNNTCSSWFEIAVHFIASGTRGYLGTMWNIKNPVAIKSAKLFYEEVFNNGNIAIAFHKMNKFGTSKEDQDIYIFWGLHFSTLKKPSEVSDQIIFNELLSSFLRWMKKYNTTKIEEVRKNCVPIMNFIYKEVRQNFNEQHLNKLEAELETKAEAFMKSLPGEADQDSLTERGVIDLG